MNLPDKLLYLPSHEWANLDGQEATVGITDFAQKELGDVTFVDLPAVGSKVTQGKEFGSVESVKAASELYSPVTGTVISVNADLESAPELVNVDPYTKGWFMRIKLDSQPEKLLSASDYQKTLG